MQNVNPTPNKVQAAAFEYLNRGFQPVPIPFKQKGPTRSGWQKEHVTPIMVELVFPKDQMNIGVRLGPDSNGLIDIDLDSPEAIACAPYILPTTGAIFGRASNRISHWLYLCPELPEMVGKASLPINDANFNSTQNSDSGQSKTNKPLILELRCGGGGRAAQTVFPPSVHPSGERVEWETGADGFPATVIATELLQAVKQLAVTALITRYMPPQGVRHETYLRIGGLLARAGLPLARIKLIAEASAKASGANPIDAVRTVNDAFNAHKTGTHVYGLKALRELVGMNFANQIADLIGYGIHEHSESANILEDKHHQDPNMLDGVQLIRADSIKPEAVEWAWPYYLAKGKLQIIAGAPGTGKTTLALSLASVVSRGGLWPDGSISNANNVVIWSGEDGVADTLVPRLLAAKANMGRIFFVEAVREMGKIRQFDPAKDVHSLEKKIKEVGGANLVIIDPIVSVVSGDTHKNAETRRGLQPLVDLALCTKVAIIGITHLSKGSKGNNPIERVTGSLAFGAVARAVFLTISKSAAADNSTSHQNSNNDDTDQSSVNAFVRVKSNIGPTGDGFEYHIQNKLLEEHSNIEASFVKWGKAICGNAQSIIAQYEATEETFQDSSNDVVKKASQFLIEFLNPKASWSVEVKNSAQEIGISPSALNRAKNVLRIVSTKQSDGKWFWSLPDTTNFD